ncbi:hypothetical protein [Duganella guangzhouensis]|nr:hypothetical protein [Duganella guangzhouensis]
MRKFLLKIILDDKANDIFTYVLGSLLMGCLLSLAILATFMGR